MAVSKEVSEAVFAYYPRLRKVKEHVDRHLGDDLSLAAAARIAGLEEKYFSSFFHEKTGMCFRDWIARTRVDQAAEMFSSQDYTITYTALAVGFRDLRTFERAFKRWRGMTPRAYKRSVQPQ